ncbi:ATP-dependent helicase [Sesbania bispinosa]|nr:ATP-dependent helicase [Sesbania bispinosa]
MEWEIMEVLKPKAKYLMTPHTLQTLTHPRLVYSVAGMDLYSLRHMKLGKTHAILHVDDI